MRPNTLTARIVAFVTANPGCTRAELLAGVGIDDDPRQAMPTHLRKAGLIHAAGPRHWQRYYATAEQAAAVHDQLVKWAAERRLGKKRNHWIQCNLRQRAARQAASGKTRNTRPGRHIVKLDPDVKLAPDVRVTIAPPMRDRWAA